MLQSHSFFFNYFILIERKYKYILIPSPTLHPAAIETLGPITAFG